jgi:hypothetical protein
VCCEEEEEEPGSGQVKIQIEPRAPRLKPCRGCRDRSYRRRRSSWGREKSEGRNNCKTVGSKSMSTEDAGVVEILNTTRLFSAGICAVTGLERWSLES